jgi:ABC-2 type transport system ATP-binding protein
LTGAGTSVPGVRRVTHHAGDGHAVVELVLAEERVLGDVFASMHAARVSLLSLTKHEPTLEDVFVALVGRSMEEVEHAREPAAV